MTLRLWGPPTDCHCRQGAIQVPQLSSQGSGNVAHLLSTSTRGPRDEPRGTCHFLTFPCSFTPGSLTPAVHPVGRPLACFVRALTLHTSPGVSVISW